MAQCQIIMRKNRTDVRCQRPAVIGNDPRCRRHGGEPALCPHGYVATNAITQASVVCWNLECRWNGD